MQDPEETRLWWWAIQELVGKVGVAGVIESLKRCTPKKKKAVALLLRHASEDPKRLPDRNTQAGESLAELWAWFEKNDPDLIYPN